MGRRLLAALLASLLVAGACSGDDQEADPGPGPGPVESTAPWEVRSSVEQLIIAGADGGQELSVVDDEGAVVAKAAADDDGNAIVRELTPGDGYRVVATEDADLTSAATEVWAVEDAPDASLYEGQELGEGFQYLETRDGTLLAVNVTLPGPVEDGPYPTVIEYSGYSPADPDALQPLLSLANLLGYATVGVNMRGTGCSGGSFLFFEPAQWTDGYDAIEAVAAQPWSTGQVGMVGISYPGISQLFVAQTQPPSLAAITPLSVIDDTYRSTLYPGGILNNGFATSWAEERQRDGAELGQAWAQKRVDEGDRVCEENQAYRTQNPDLFDFIDDAAFVPEDRTGYIGRLAPSEWVDRIEVPVFLAGAWQDEQTGGHFPALLDPFTGSPPPRFVLTNRGQRVAWTKPARAGRERVIEAVCRSNAGGDPDEVVRRGLSRLAACGLADARLMVAPARQLSQGELARLSLAVALARRREGEPITLLVDEFASALDDDTAIGVASGLARVVARDPALRVIVATHRRACVAAMSPSVRVRL